MNKKIIALFAAVVVVLLSPAHAKSSGGSGGSHSTKGYVKKDGTYVQPHRATNPDGTKSNNWSQSGNVNPYTGKPGTKSD